MQDAYEKPLLSLEGAALKKSSFTELPAESDDDDENELLPWDDISLLEALEESTSNQRTNCSNLENLAINAKDTFNIILSFLSCNVHPGISTRNEVGALAVTCRTMNYFIFRSLVGLAMKKAHETKLSCCQMLCIKPVVIKTVPWGLSGLSVLTGTLIAAGSGALIAYSSRDAFVQSNTNFLIWVQNKYPHGRAAQIIAERTEILGGQSVTDAVLGALFIASIYGFLSALLGVIWNSFFCCKIPNKIFGGFFLALTSTLGGLLLAYAVELVLEAFLGVFDTNGNILDLRFATLFIAAQFFPTQGGVPFYGKGNMTYFIENTSLALALISGSVAGLTSSLSVQSLNFCSARFFKKQETRVRRFSDAMESIDANRQDWPQNRNSLSHPSAIGVFSKKGGLASSPKRNSERSSFETPINGTTDSFTISINST